MNRRDGNERSSTSVEAPSDGPHGRATRWIAGAFVVVAGAFVLASVLHARREIGSLEDLIRAYPWRVSWTWLFGSLSVWAGALLATAALWTWLFRSAGGRIDVRTGIRAWTTTNLGRYIPGRLWQLAGLALYVRGRAASGALAIRTSVLLQMVTLVVGLGLGVGLVGRSSGLIGSPLAIVAWVVVLASGLHPRVLRSLERWLARRLGEEIGGGEGAERPGVAIRSLLGGSAGMLVIWAAHGLGFWMLLNGLLEMAARPGWILSTGVFAASYVTGYLVLFAPAGLVAREGALAALLSLSAGVPGVVALALAAAARMMATTAELIAIGVSWALGGRPEPAAGASTGGEGEPRDRRGKEGVRG